LPNEWQNIAKINVGITAGFEGNYVKKDWISQVNKMDHVIVPSSFSKKSFENTSKKYDIKINKRINVINEWFYPKFSNVTEKKYLFLNNTKFNKNILIAGQISSSSSNDRKNIIKTINSVYTSIQDNNDIGILLKVNSGSYSYLNRLQLIDIIRNSFDKNVLKKIQLLFGYGDVSEMKYLYESNKIICLVSGSKAEGWGLHLLEAAACGLPIIATNYSAYKEFLSDNFLSVDYNLIDIDKNEYSQFIDEISVQWADFDSDDMIFKIKSLINNYNFYKEKSKELKEIIKQRYSLSHIIKDYKLFFESLY
jgi:glycosyltransferase involved in cell wall biosynthesis